MVGSFFPGMKKEKSMRGCLYRPFRMSNTSKRHDMTLPLVCCSSLKGGHPRFPWSSAPECNSKSAEQLVAGSEGNFVRVKSTQDPALSPAQALIKPIGWVVASFFLQTANYVRLRLQEGTNLRLFAGFCWVLGVTSSDDFQEKGRLAWEEYACLAGRTPVALPKLHVRRLKSLFSQF